MSLHRAEVGVEAEEDLVGVVVEDPPLPIAVVVMAAVGTREIGMEGEEEIAALAVMEEAAMVKIIVVHLPLTVVGRKNTPRYFAFFLTSN
mmetsp:Transcript_11900/g.21465  ORF Transcript_11900/g.21465 Transcript_11900/m.21465 type:complete len:90 (-) Transcript_11900:33-302(-)